MAGGQPQWHVQPALPASPSVPLLSAKGGKRRLDAWAQQGKLAHAFTRDAGHEELLLRSSPLSRLTTPRDERASLNISHPCLALDVCVQTSQPFMLDLVFGCDDGSRQQCTLSTQRADEGSSAEPGSARRVMPLALMSLENEVGYLDALSAASERRAQLAYEEMRSRDGGARPVHDKAQRLAELGALEELAAPAEAARQAQARLDVLLRQRQLSEKDYLDQYKRSISDAHARRVALLKRRGVRLSAEEARLELERRAGYQQARHRTTRGAA